MNTYLEKCKEAASTVDVPALAALEFGETVGTNGSSFEFRRLSQLTICHANTYAGLKVPIKHARHAWFKVLREVAYIDLATQGSPQFTSYVPAFMSLVEVEGSDAQAILMEDVSQNGQKEVTERSASRVAREMLHLPFKQHGSISSVLNPEVCDKSIAFDVEGDERLLDFTPAPVEQHILRKSEEYQASTSLVRRTIEDMTITLPFESALGQALHNSMAEVQ